MLLKLVTMLAPLRERVILLAQMFTNNSCFVLDEHLD